jgi:Transposase DDE domain
MHDSTNLQVQDIEAARPDLIENLSQWINEYPTTEPKKKKMGRPREVQWAQIMLGLLVSILFGMSNYQHLWRRLRGKELGAFAPIEVGDDAIITRLKHAGSAPFQELLEQMGSQPAEEGTALTQARFAPEIVAIDEMSGDQMRKQLKEQRALVKGDKQLLPGKLAGRFNIRRQQWELVEWREDAQANCKKNVLNLIKGLVVGSLLLFDLGYFAFWWFDDLGARGYWWVSRLREKTSYELVHVFWRFEGNIDALVWLGAYRADRAGRLVRMVRYWDGKLLHTYITNVLDPHQLSLKEIAQLYGRRWDIELAFLLIKEYLGLHHWWSSRRELIKQQCLAILIVAQQIQKMRMQMAIQAGVDAFEVSLPLLMQVLPELLQEKQEPLEWMKRHGKDLKLIRASSRLEPVVVQVREEEIVMPVGELYQERKARYHSYGEEEEKKKEHTTPSKTGEEKKRKKEKEEKKERKGKEVVEKVKGGRRKKKEERKKEVEVEVGTSNEHGKGGEERREEEKEKPSLKQKEKSRGKKKEEEEEKALIDEKSEMKEQKEKIRRGKGKETKEASFVQGELPCFSG